MNHPAIKNVTFTPKFVHDHSIDWPNGRGYTPCTKAYFAKYHAKMDIYNPNNGGSIDNLSPRDYQRWCELDHEVMQMSLDGHVAPSVRY